MNMRFVPALGEADMATRDKLAGVDCYSKRIVLLLLINTHHRPPFTLYGDV